MFSPRLEKTGVREAYVKIHKKGLSFAVKLNVVKR
jgi:hypothetical protein